jgi:hypothetical protein
MLLGKARPRMSGWYVSSIDLKPFQGSWLDHLFSMLKIKLP